MNAFMYCAPTTLYVGGECVLKNAALLKGLGNRAYIITSRFPQNVRHLSLEDAEAACKEQGIEYEVFMDAVENPPVLSIAAIAGKIKAFGPDFLIACGGGSAIDTAKALDVLIKYPDEDPYKVFYGNDFLSGSSLGDGAVPLIAIPTTAGTGSEVSPFAILSREDTDTKLVIKQKVYPQIAFLDAKYIKDAPPRLIHSGAIDALAHGVETYVNTKSNVMTRSLAEIGFKLFAEFKDAMKSNTLTVEDFQKMSLAATIQGMAMQSGTTLPHGMGYPLSHHKNVPHGLACGVFIGEYVRGFKDKSLVMPIVEMCGFDTIDQFADYINTILDQDIKIEVTEEEIKKWSEEMFGLKVRIEKHPEPVTLEEIEAIYNRALLK